MNFYDKISAYYTENKRDLPWRNTKDPYKIWLSEIIMQQTQISQETAYYYKFIATYPTVFDLTKANEQEILVLWKEPGYYSGARNLLHPAKEIIKKLKLVNCKISRFLKLSEIFFYTNHFNPKLSFYNSVKDDFQNIINFLFNFRVFVPM